MRSLKNRWIKWFPKDTWLLIGKVRIQLAPRCLSESSFAETHHSGGLASEPSCSPVKPGWPVSSWARWTHPSGSAGRDLQPVSAGMGSSAKHRGGARKPTRIRAGATRSSKIHQEACNWSPSVWLLLRSFNSFQTQTGKGGDIYHFGTSTCFRRWSDETLLSCNEICPLQSESLLSPEIYSLLYTLLSILQGL